MSTEEEEEAAGSPRWDTSWTLAPRALLLRVPGPALPARGWAPTSPREAPLDQAPEGEWVSLSIPVPRATGRLCLGGLVSSPTSPKPPRARGVKAVRGQGPTPPPEPQALPTPHGGARAGIQAWGLPTAERPARLREIHK